jgi:SAM-dependent methyltransferase
MNTSTTLSKRPHLAALSARLNQRFPYFAKTVQKRLDDFGDMWADDFEEELRHFFAADEQALVKATDGYGTFALDAMKLQKRFDKDRHYVHKSYKDVAEAVYHSSSYMFDLYLPGILLSQFLWPHHYRQLKFFRDRFIPKARKMPVRLFFDVGVGTGFYSKEMLRQIPGVLGRGFDISEHSLAHTKKMLDLWQLSQNYELHCKDILQYDENTLADAIISVEVLEHLEDPVAFLKGLFRVLRRGGIGYITAAINAPNADHIYLYRNLGEVAAEIRSAGFTILDGAEFFAYEPRAQESVPSGGVFVVEKTN